jgi:hypothetical protein
MIRLLVSRLKCSRKNFSLFVLMSRHVDFREYTYISFIKKDVTLVLSVFHWDVNCSEVSDKIQPQVFPCMNHFPMRVLIKFSENSTYRICRQINTYAHVVSVKL